MTQNKLKLAVLMLGFVFMGGSVVSAQSGITPDRAVYNTATRFTVTISNEKDSSMKMVVVELPKGTSNVSLLQNTSWQGVASKEEITWTGDLRSGFSTNLSFYANTPSTGTSARFTPEVFYKNGDTQKLNSNNFMIKTGSAADIKTDIEIAQSKADRAFGLGVRATLFALVGIILGLVAFLKISHKI